MSARRPTCFCGSRIAIYADHGTAVVPQRHMITTRGSEKSTARERVGPRENERGGGGGAGRGGAEAEGECTKRLLSRGE